MQRYLHYAANFGIISLLIGIPLGIIDILETLKEVQLMSLNLYIAIYLISIIFYVLFIYGFVLLGKKIKNKKLTTASYLLIMGSVTLNLFQILTPFFPKLQGILYQALVLVALGIVSIVFGRALIKLQFQLGKIAKAAGVLNIITGISMITVVLSFVGVILLIPIYMMEIIILFRASKNFDSLY